MEEGVPPLCSAVVRPDGLTGPTAVPRAPVAIVAFNRPDLTRRVVERVLEAEPRDVYLLADGPRPGNAGDADRCAAVRVVFDEAAWPAGVHRRYLEQNLGCGPAVASGIDWVFDQVDRAIILEDDCLPDVSFFRFCDELLERYADDTRVMHVSGTNLLAPEALYGGFSYGFAGFAPIWGWATWGRAWRHYDRLMTGWPAFRDAGMVSALRGSRQLHRLYADEWDRAHRGEMTWDHQWQYTVLSQNGLTASPGRNLVTNLGFREDATQTAVDIPWEPVPGEVTAMEAQTMPFPLRHPAIVAPNPRIEKHLERVLLRYNGRLVGLFRRVVPSQRARRAILRVAQPVMSLRRARA